MGPDGARNELDDGHGLVDFLGGLDNHADAGGAGLSPDAALAVEVTVEGDEQIHGVANAGVVLVAALLGETRNAGAAVGEKLAKGGAGTTARRGGGGGESTTLACRQTSAQTSNAPKQRAHTRSVSVATPSSTLVKTKNTSLLLL